MESDAVEFDAEQTQFSKVGRQHFVDEVASCRGCAA
jgi:hypothetical protein